MMCVQGRWKVVHLFTIFGNARHGHYSDQTGVHCRSVGGAQCISWCDCMTSLSALLTCAEPSLQLCGNLCFGPYPGKPNLNASLPPDFVVWVRGVRPGCGSCHRMWGSLPPFHFFLHTLPPRKDHVRIIGPCVGLASHLCLSGARYHINVRSPSQCLMNLVRSDNGSPLG